MVKFTWIALVISFAVYTFFVNTLTHNSAKKELTPVISEGWKIWQDKNCQACHQIYGLGGYMGPDLTNSASTVGKDYMKIIMESGTSRMPNFHLSKDEIEKLTRFLSWVDESGKSAVNKENVHWSGTYIIDNDGQN